MHSRQHRTSKNSSNSSDNPAPNQFAPRGFVIQPKTEEVTPVQEQKPEEQTQKEEVKPYKSAFIDASKFKPRPPAKIPRVQMKLTTLQSEDMHQQEVVQPQREETNSENLNDEYLESLVRKANSNWKKVIAKYLSNPEMMRQIIGFREREVKRIIDKVKARLKGAEFKAVAVGSNDLTSDYDITFDASGNQSIEIKAVTSFNKIFREKWGKESGSVFDTNVYTTGHMPVGESKEEKEEFKKETQGQMTPEAEKSSLANQDIMSLLKIRRFMSDANWKKYKNKIVNGIQNQDHRLEIINRFIEVDNIYKLANIQMERKIDELNKGVITLDKSIEERIKYIKKTNPDAEIEASNRLFEKYLGKVDRTLKELEKLKQEVKESGVRSKEQSDKLDKLTLKLQHLRSMALVFANEAYHTGGAVEHVVINQQMKLNISITTQQYLESINEQTGFAQEQINHNKDEGTALWKSAKYVDRLCDAIEKIDLENFKPPEEQKSLWILAKELLQIKKAQGNYENLKTDKQKSEAAKEVAKKHGYPSKAAFSKAVLNLNQLVNKGIRTNLS